MAANNFAERVSRLQPRFIGVAAQIALGASTLVVAPVPGSSSDYIENQLNMPHYYIGALFIAAGVIAGITDNKWVYWLAGVSFLVLYSILTFIGSIDGSVPMQAGILYLALATYAFIVFPQREDYNVS